jgi:hypothetical protein
MRKAELFIAGIIVGAAVVFGLTKMPESKPSKVRAMDKTADAKWQWADSLDAVKAAPNSHKVLFENNRIRILEVTVEPFGFEPMHTHRYPGVMFRSGDNISQYDIIYYRYSYDSVKHLYFAKDTVHQHAGGPGPNAAQAHFMKPEGPHRIKNLSKVRIVAFRVELKPDSDRYQR